MQNLGHLICLAVFFVPVLHSQNILLLEESINVKNDSLINSLKSTFKKPYLSLLPSVNYSTFSGIGANFNFSNYINFRQQKKRNQIELLKLKTTLEDKKNSLINKALYDLEILESLKKQIENDFLILEKHYQIFKIKMQEFENLQISVIDKINAEIKYLTIFNNTKNKINTLKIKLLKFQNKFNFSPFTIITLLKTAKKYEYKTNNSQAVKSKN